MKSISQLTSRFNVVGQVCPTYKILLPTKLLIKIQPSQKISRFLIYFQSYDENVQLIFLQTFIFLLYQKCTIFIGGFTAKIKRGLKSSNKHKKICRVSESNQGHRDFQSLALPTELTRHILFNYHTQTLYPLAPSAQVLQINYIRSKIIIKH